MNILERELSYRSMELTWKNFWRFLIIVWPMDQYMCAQFASKPGLNAQLFRCQKWDWQKMISEQCLKNVQWTMHLKMRECICKTCWTAIIEARIPKLSVYNKMGFPEQPPEFKLFTMEERLIAQRIPFMQIRSHPIGHQTFVWGNIVNVPVDIAPTVKTLSRNLSDTETVAIKVRRKKEYKKYEFQENVRPIAVMKALHYLMKESALYQEDNILVDTTWLDRMRDNDEEAISSEVTSTDSATIQYLGDSDAENEDLVRCMKMKNILLIHTLCLIIMTLQYQQVMNSLVHWKSRSPLVKDRYLEVYLMMIVQNIYPFQPFLWTKEARQ